MSDSSLQFGSFSIDDSFLWADGPANIGSVSVQTITGSKGVYRKFVKDVFTVSWPYLTQAQKETLEPILSAVGAGAKHSVTYVTPQATRYYNGSSTSTDTPRIRGKVVVNSYTIKHFEGSANEWEAVAECEET